MAEPRERDIQLFARTRLSLLRAKEDATSRNDTDQLAKLDAQLSRSPYSDRAVVLAADRLLRVTTPPPSQRELTVAEKIRGTVFPT